MPKKTKSKMFTFRMRPVGAAALSRIKRRLNWTATTAITESLVFSDKSPEFGKPKEDGR